MLIDSDPDIRRRPPAYDNSPNAAPPVFESTLGIRTLDARTGQPVEGAVVVASEHYYWTAFHNSGTTCFRAVAKRLESRGEAGILRLPAVDPLTSAKVIDETRHVEVFGYRAGYCAAQPYAAAEQAGFTRWANRGGSSGGWGKVETPQFGTTIVNASPPRADRSPDPRPFPSRKEDRSFGGRESWSGTALVCPAAWPCFGYVTPAMVKPARYICNCMGCFR